ncbi:FUSC family protein [Rhizobium mesosinicum]|uniref:FUSC family protein n=1 Tax=Rhizobium mesosinicum TaxID=335017 RepID=UPI001C6DEE6E|nr:FUSC family protein [Rhizobium mesosinicum]
MKTTQRVIGVLFGVCCARLLSFVALPSWADVLVIGMLGGARPFLRARNYLTYSIVMTPLSMMAMGTADHALPTSALLVGYLQLPRQPRNNPFPAADGSA